MGFKRLEKNLIDIIKEEQAKLGFRKEEIRLYYPLISLNHFFEADDDVDEMQTDSACIFRNREVSMYMNIRQKMNSSKSWWS